MQHKVIQEPGELTSAYLEQCLGVPVHAFTVEPVSASCSNQAKVLARTERGTEVLRLKCCSNDFGPSEVDYYLRDYVDLPSAPLVKCYGGQHHPEVGYHLLLADISAEYENWRDRSPSAGYGLNLAQELARLHRHHWMSRPLPESGAIDRYFEVIGGGAGPLKDASGIDLGVELPGLQARVTERLRHADGMSLLHGDLNPTNVITPRDADAPMLFLDRQPFDWSFTYGLAVTDLADALLPWWPTELLLSDGERIVRRWHDTLGIASYSWEQALADWRLAVDMSLRIPLFWCTDARHVQSMRRLWQTQLDRILAYRAATRRDDTRPGC